MEMALSTPSNVWSKSQSCWIAHITPNDIGCPENAGGDFIKRAAITLDKVPKGQSQGCKVGEPRDIDWHLGSLTDFNAIKTDATPSVSVPGHRCPIGSASDWRRAHDGSGNRALVDEVKAARLRFETLSNADRLDIALRTAFGTIPGLAMTEIAALLTPGNLVSMAAFFAVFLGANATPVGWIVSVTLVSAGWLMFGIEAVNLIGQVVAFGTKVLQAKSEADLQKAGRDFGKVIAKVGVDIIVGILLKKATIKIADAKPVGGANQKVKVFKNYEVDEISSRSTRNIEPQPKPELSPPANKGSVPELSELEKLKTIDTTKLTRAEKGKLAEARAALTYKKAGYEELPARLPSNHGFDGVFVKKSPNGEVTEIIINESKFSSSGNVSLPTTNMGKQMSPEWIDANIGKMMNSADPAIVETGMLLDANRHLIRAKMNVLDPAGNNVWTTLNLSK